MMLSNNRMCSTLLALLLVSALIGCADNPTAPDTSSKDDEFLRAIEHLENRMDKGFAEVNRQIAGVRNEIGKLNQNQQRRT